VVSPRKKQVVIILAILACTVCLDQVTKAVIRAALPANDFSYLKDGVRFFRFVHQQNRGLLGGMWTGKGVLTLAAPIVASFVLLHLYRYLDRESRLQSAAYGMVGGGALGNLVDRLRLGYVTDFLQFHFYFIPFNFPWKYYPAFNIADSAICTGVFFLVITWHKVKGQDAPHAA
jgi:signal peptidase II